MLSLVSVDTAVSSEITGAVESNTNGKNKVLLTFPAESVTLHVQSV